ncbi:very large low complexity protein [Fusarium sporotrichioides]|uniref:Very large low complexity protein n=1 Tax=Fusarium sporotrichioides TaxID=5514 RepID=A0A395RR43_FUSSP|nr:very large low complexity protein [Fusarium sporotrichioides]
MSLHTSQGFDFCQPTNALWKYRSFSEDPAERKRLLDSIQHQAVAKLDFDCLKDFTTRLCEQKLDLSGDYSSAFEELELEREVEFEFEQLREKEKPAKYTATAFPGLDPAITAFVTAGYFEEGDIFI